MGSMTDERIAAWQRKAGIRPARSDAADLLNEMSETAVGLVKLIELEKAGICDGDGFWHGSDPLGGTVAELNERWRRYRAKSRDDGEPDSDKETNERFQDEMGRKLNKLNEPKAAPDPNGADHCNLCGEELSIQVRPGNQKPPVRYCGNSNCPHEPPEATGAYALITNIAAARGSTVEKILAEKLAVLTRRVVTLERITDYIVDPPKADDWTSDL